MQALFTVFMIAIFAIAVFIAAVFVRDVVIEEKERRKKEGSLASEKSETEDTPVQTASAATEQTMETAVTESEATELSATDEMVIDTEAENDSGAVTFSAGSQTLDEKYLELSQEYKGYYDEIVRSAMAIEGSKRYKNSAYEEYKVGKSRLVKLKIKRGTVVCELTIPNLAFKSYISSNKIAMKQAPATIKVTDAASLGAVKDSIGIAVKEIEEERAYKKEQARLRRKKNREAEKETV